MVSDAEFFTNFRDNVIDVEHEDDDEKKQSPRIKFFMHQYMMIPPKTKDIISNLTRAYPTPPIYAFLGLGVIGTNIARYSAVRRIGDHFTHSERTGVFYNLIAPSRHGKGITTSLIFDIGAHIELVRKQNYET